METRMNGITHPAIRSAVAPYFRRILRAVRNLIVKRAIARAFASMDDATLCDLATARDQVSCLTNLVARALTDGESDSGRCAGSRCPGPGTGCRIETDSGAADLPLAA
jgi:uncharacterized protein YjiS (DUF1127 family)